MDLDQVYLEHFNDLYRYLYFLSNDHHQAEDLAHETFYRAFLQIQSSDINEVRPWLFKVGYHAFIDLTRRNKKLIITDKIADRLDNEYDFKANPEDKYLKKEELHELKNFLNKLSPNEKNAIILCDFHKLKEKDAAEILNMKLNTIKSHLYRGRKKLVRMIKRSEENEG